MSIPRTTYEQVAALPAVSTSDLQPGDLLFFAGDSHVGMYVGGGMLIDAPQTGQDVEKVALSGWYSDEPGQRRAALSRAAPLRFIRCPQDMVLGAPGFPRPRPGRAGARPGRSGLRRAGILAGR